MKTCSKCSKEKNLSQFAWRSKSKNQLHGQCNDCRRLTAQQSYRRHQEKVTSAVREKKSSYKDVYINWKNKLSCVCCGENYIKCVEFHHIDQNEKDYGISEMISRYPLTSILKEVSKCIVVCSNCHRKIHGGAIEVTNNLIQKSNEMINNSL